MAKKVLEKGLPSISVDADVAVKALPDKSPTNKDAVTESATLTGPIA